MIHEPSQWTGGTASQLETASEMLRGLTNQLAAIYAARSGTAAEAWVETLSGGDTWYDATQALAAGLVDAVVDPKPLPDGVTEQTVFARLFRRPTTAGKPGRPAILASAGQSVPRFGLVKPDTKLIVPVARTLPPPPNPAMPTFMERIRAALNLPINATDEEVAAAAEAAKAAETTEEVETPATDPAPSPPATPAAETTEEVDPVTARLDRFERMERTRIINAAIADFKIGESERADWDRRLTNDFDAESAALAAIPRGRVNPSSHNPSAPKASSQGSGTRTRAQIRNAARDKAAQSLTQ
jgi:hypothetical protein